MTLVLNSNPDLATPERRPLISTSRPSHDDITPVKVNLNSKKLSSIAKVKQASAKVKQAGKVQIKSAKPVDPHHACEEEANKPTSLLEMAQYAVSVAILGLAVSLIMAGIITKQTPIALSMGPLAAGAAMWLLIFWLGILEGVQGCLVGLQPVPSSKYEHTHQHTAHCTRIGHHGNNLNRFIVGRQFLVVLVVFLLNLCCTTVDGSEIAGIPSGLLDGVVTSGLAVMLITVMLGQLAAEVNATNCMLDFINTPIVVVTTYLCLAIEASGLLHSVYLVECLFPNKTTSEESTSSTTEIVTGDNETTTANEEDLSTAQRVWYWIRVAVSVSALGFAMAVTCAALWHGETTMYPGLNTVGSFAFFIGLVCFLGILEAIQIAVFAVVKLDQESLDEAAQATCRLVFTGRNFKATLIGRQICVTTCMFLLARITTTSVDPADLVDTAPLTSSTVLGVPAFIQDIFNTGLPGALITTIVASLMWRIAAASYPIYFMSNSLVRLTIRLCLLLEASGVFSAAWLLADGAKVAGGFKPDDEYLEPASPSVSKNICVDEESLKTMSTRSSSSLTDYGTLDNSLDDGSTSSSNESVSDFGCLGDKQ